MIQDCSRCHIGNRMEVRQLPIEVRFAPLTPEECEERSQRLHGLLLRGALRLAQHHSEQESQSLAEVNVRQ